MGNMQDLELECNERIISYVNKKIHLWEIEMVDQILEYLPEIVTALWGLFTGILLEKVNSNKEKKIAIFELRKSIYMEITKLISNIPVASCPIEVLEEYYHELLNYYDKHTYELILISNTKVADLFTEYIKLLGVYIDKSEWNDKNRDEALEVAQKLIDKMRKKLLSFD